MNIQNKNEPLLNAAWGLAPWLLFIFIQNFISYRNALITGFLAWGIFMFYYLKIRRTLVVRILLKISGGALIIQTLALLVKIQELYLTIFSEAILLAILWFFINFKQKISKSLLKHEPPTTKQTRSMTLNELFYVSYICRDTLFVHLIIVLIYSILPLNIHTAFLDNLIYKHLGIILISLVIAYEHIRLSMIKKKLSSEEWLPVVNDSGRVIGKVAKSVSFRSGSKYLHPLVRIALICKGKIYLMQRPEHYQVGAGKADLPFEKHLSYDQTLEDAVNEIIITHSRIQEIKPRFLFKYKHETPKGNRLIYLYAIQIHDNEIMDKIRLNGGKVWTEKQIEENLEKDVFFECFELEYDTIKNTVLLAEKLFIQQEDARSL